MGLSFLNKKIWHPGSFSNIEKVWIAEQKHKELERKAIENAKKVKEEKAIEELKKIQVEHGLIPASHLNRLDFMYQGPENSSKINTAEEFLLGKPLNNESEANKRHFTPIFQESYTNPQNEAFTKLHEDPLFNIMKEEMKQRKEIESNPYKIKMLLKDIEKKDKKEKKEKNEKKEKRDKKEKKDKYYYHYDDEDDYYKIKKYTKEEKERKKDKKKSHYHHHYHKYKRDKSESKF
jgi:hypothetical protein